MSKVTSLTPSERQDRLTVEKQGAKGFTLTRTIRETIDPKEFEKRLVELETSRKHLTNELEKLEQAKVNCLEELDRIERNERILRQAKKTGFAEFTLE